MVSGSLLGSRPELLLLSWRAGSRWCTAVFLPCLWSQGPGGHSQKPVYSTGQSWGSEPLRSPRWAASRAASPPHGLLVSSGQPGCRGRLGQSVVASWSVRGKQLPRKSKHTAVQNQPVEVAPACWWPHTAAWPPTPHEVLWEALCPSHDSRDHLQHRQDGVPGGLAQHPASQARLGGLGHGARRGAAADRAASVSPCTAASMPAVSAPCLGPRAGLGGASAWGCSLGDPPSPGPPCGHPRGPETQVPPF